MLVMTTGLIKPPTNKKIAKPWTLGIRKMYWVRGWPTIWAPITVTFSAEDNSDAIGQKLGIALQNTGDRGSVAAFDWVNLEVTDSLSQD